MTCRTVFLSPKPHLVTLLLAIALVCIWSNNVFADISPKSYQYLPDNNPLHALDVYQPEKSTPKPAIVLLHFHGGAWKFGDKTALKQSGEFYAKRGIVFIAANYRLTPEVTHPSHVQDCAAALTWVFKHLDKFNGDKKRVYLSGHSAGAHLATLLATNDQYLSLVGLTANQLAGVIVDDTASFNLVDNRNEVLVNRFIKQAFGRDKTVLTDASPLLQLHAGQVLPPFLVLNTTKRKIAVKAGAEFAQQVNRIGGTATFIPIDDHTHQQMADGMHQAEDPVAKAFLAFLK